MMTMTDELYEKNQSLFPKNHLHIQKTQITDSEAAAMLDRYLACESRTLTKGQKEKVLDCYRITKDTDLLQALIENAVQTKSYKEISVANSYKAYITEQLEALIEKNIFRLSSVREWRHICLHRERDFLIGNFLVS